MAFIPALLAATALTGAVGFAGASIANAGKAPKSSGAAAAAAPIASPIVAADEGITGSGSSGASAEDKNAARIGRASLIATSPLGVLSTEPTGRRKLLGN